MSTWEKIAVSFLILETVSSQILIKLIGFKSGRYGDVWQVFEGCYTAVMALVAIIIALRMIMRKTHSPELSREVQPQESS